MFGGVVGERTHGESSDEPHRTQSSTKSFSCDYPSCKATTLFDSLSKLKLVLSLCHVDIVLLTKNSKHRNSHEKPYKCLAVNCSKRFAQQQHLDRHTQIKHQETNLSTKYYHCTVDGCKYASTGRSRKKFARLDQAKEHIKDYGHYGPHSANDRSRRPGNRLWEDHSITVFFEEWALHADGSGNLQPRRIVQSCEYDTHRTKLWHADDTGDLYLRGDVVGILQGIRDNICPTPDCYYQLFPRPGLETTVFKTARGLQEHYRNAHELPSQTSSLPSRLPSPERQDSCKDSGSTPNDLVDLIEMGTFLNSMSSTSSHESWDLFPGSEDLSLPDWISGSPFHAPPRNCACHCYCGATNSQQSNLSASFPTMECPSQLQLSSLSSSENFIDSSYMCLNTDSDQGDERTPSNNATLPIKSTSINPLEM